MVPESLRLYSPSVLKVVVFEARDQESIELFHKARGPLETERFESFDLWKSMCWEASSQSFLSPEMLGPLGLALTSQAETGTFKEGGNLVRRTFVSTLNEFHGTFPSSWSHSCMNKEPFPDIWGAAGWWNVVDSRGWTLSPFFHRHHCEQSRSSIQVSRLLRVLGLASYLMVQTVQNMPSVQPCCKVSLEQVPSEQVLGEHGHPDVQLWPAAVCWSMDHKVGSYSSNISRCLKMSQDVSRCLKVSQGVSRAHSKLQPSLQFFKDLCCLLCIWLVCFKSTSTESEELTWCTVPSSSWSKLAKSL